MNQVLTNADELRDIHPPVVIPNLWIWVWIALAFCVVAASVVVVLYFLLKRRQVPPMLPVVPAHVRARQKLDEALAHIAQAKVFCTMVSDTIRIYLEERFDFHAPERTTEEFLYELRGTNLLLPDQKESLGEFLKRCDLVKFARYEPGQPELRDLRESALRLVDETEPQPEPAVIAEPPIRNPQSAIANQQ